MVHVIAFNNIGVSIVEIYLITIVPKQPDVRMDFLLI